MRGGGRIKGGRREKREGGGGGGRIKGGRRERRGMGGGEEQKQVRVYKKVCPMQLSHQISIVTEKSDIDFEKHGKMEIARTIRTSSSSTLLRQSAIL